MKRKLQLLLLLLLTSLTGMAADDMQQYVPSNFGGWKNLSASVNDLTHYTTDPLPMQAAVSGKTIHVFWADWKPNAAGEYCIYYRRSTDAGKTWEDARAIVKSKNMSLADINYVGGNFGSNAKWYNVDGQNVQVVTPVKSDDGNNSELLFTNSTDGGKTFQQRILAKGSDGDGHYYYGRPHVVSDGQTLVVAFQHSRFNSTSYKTRVLTSFDGGSSFNDKEIDTVQDLVDVKVSGKRWAVLGNDMYWYYNMWWGNVYISTSTDGGETITTQNVAPLVKDDTSWCSLEYMKGFNGAAFNYHPQMTLEGDVINVIFRGCAEEVEGKSPTDDRNHTIFRRSTDGGKTWTRAIYIPDTNGSEGAIAAKGENIYVLQTPNGPVIHHSHDGGKTWEVQRQCYWTGRYEGYSNFYELYIAPDDASGQHVYLTGCRALLVESKNGFRDVERTFSMGTESWYGGRTNNHSLTVLLDSEGTEHWFMDYQAPYKNNDPYFRNIVYRRNDPAPATTGKEMAFDISKKVYAEQTQRVLNDITIPITPSIMAMQEAATVECWVRVDETDYSFEIASVTNSSTSHNGGLYYGGWYIHVSKNGDWYNFYAGLSTDLSVDGKGKEIWDRWRYQIKDKGYWHHVALTYDSKQEKNNLSFYVDGVLMGTTTERGKIVMGNNPIVIGRTSTYGDNQKAYVDNFAIWSRALTQEEIQAHIYNTPDSKDKDCRLLLTFDGSLQDQSQYHNDPAPLMDAILVEHDGIRPPHPEFTMVKEMKGQKVNVNDITQDGVGCWWILPYPGYWDNYKTSEQRHVSQDFSRDPGTYSYTLVAKGTGNCNAYASTSKMITIGGLSKVFPEESAQSKGVRLRIQGGYNLTYSKQPKVALKQGNNEIEGKWLIKYGYDMSKVVQTADDLPEALFDMSLASLGKYDVIVGSDTLSQAFTLTSEAEEPDVWMEISGRDKSLYNRWQQYTINYGNRANVAAYNTPIFIFISDKLNDVDVSFDFNYTVTNPNFDENMQAISNAIGDYSKIVDQNGDSLRCYSFVIPYIAPNSSNQRTFRIRHRTLDNPTWNPEVEIVYAMESPWGALDPDGPNPFEGMTASRMKGASGLRNINPDLAWCLVKVIGQGMIDVGVALIPGTSCAWAGIKMAAQPFIEEEYDWWSFGSSLIALGIGCSEDLVKGLAWGPYAAYKVAEFCWNTYCNVRSNGSCLDADAKKKKTKTVGSYDPNEMIGPSGYDDQAHYIKPIHQMPYLITFENKSSATAPAHEVFVTDVLDASKYDFSTFSFTGFGWAENSYTVGGGKTKEFTRDINYNVKGQDILVRVTGQFDEKTGTVHWNFVSLKKNGDEIEDPDLGFLVPNNDNRDGEGFVSFIIEHKANPANGSTVSNKATIVFDANDPIVTNTYVNTFDTDYPSSQITKVEEKDGKLVVTVSGSDATSGIGSYQIYAFKNGGEAEHVATITEGNQATFKCDSGTKYGLCVIATDNVGWNEPKDIKAETEVTTSGTGINNVLMDNPANSEFIDMQGRRLKDPKAPGIYIQNKKKVFIKKLVQDDHE